MSDTENRRRVIPQKDAEAERGQGEGTRDFVSGRSSVFLPLFCLKADATRAPEVRGADFRQERASRRPAEMECAVGRETI